jgi:signal transduction histidine kinase
MVRAKSSLILVGLLLILLPLLAVLQYRWIGEVSAAERERLESSLRVASDRFATDFDEVFTRIANAFQIRDGFPSSAAAVLADRYQAWSDIASYPRLIRAIYVLKTTPGEDPDYFKVNLTSRELETAAVPKALENIRERFRPSTIDYAADEPLMLVIPIFRPGRQFNGPRQEEFRQIRSEEFGWRGNGRGRGGPIPGSGPGSERPPRPDRGEPPGAGPGPGQGPGPGGPGPIDGETVIELDREVLLKELLPALTEKHFSSHDQTAYRLAVVKRGKDDPKVLYSSAGEWTPEDIASPDKSVNLFGNPRQPGNGRGRGPGPRTQSVVLGAPWELAVKHRAGSLELAVEQIRLRNLATAFGILLVLGAGLITVVISSQRAHTLGKLQMEFAAGVTHELRTPLAVIRSAAHNLRSGVVRDKEGVEEYAKIVQEEARRLSDMVEEVLLYSETQSGRKKYALEPVDINEVLDRAITNLSPTIDFEQCELTNRIDADLPPVKADAAALTQCVQNLLSNAYKYGKIGSTAQVEIEARLDLRAKQVLLSVIDHGAGIDPADQSQLFEAFYRGRNIGGSIPGNGLGLHLVKRIMQAQGGRVTFNTAPHGGASFTLHIPAAL